MTIDLHALPLRAIAAFAARCARRALVLQKSDDKAFLETLDGQIRVAEDFASGQEVPDAAEAVECLAEGSDAAGVVAAEAASLAAAVVTAIQEESFEAACTFALETYRLANQLTGRPLAANRDFDLLRSMSLAEFPALGQPVDATESGPLGPLSPRDTPTSAEGC